MMYYLLLVMHERNSWVLVSKDNIFLCGVLTCIPNYLLIERLLVCKRGKCIGDNSRQKKKVYFCILILRNKLLLYNVNY